MCMLQDGMPFTVSASCQTYNQTNRFAYLENWLVYLGQTICADFITQNTVQQQVERGSRAVSAEHGNKCSRVGKVYRGKRARGRLVSHVFSGKYRGVRSVHKRGLQQQSGEEVCLHEDRQDEWYARGVLLMIADDVGVHYASVSSQERSKRVVVVAAC